MYKCYIMCDIDDIFRNTRRKLEKKYKDGITKFRPREKDPCFSKRGNCAYNQHILVDLGEYLEIMYIPRFTRLYNIGRDISEDELRDYLNQKFMYFQKLKDSENDH